jgi:ketosteroid isomerase-like protein
VVEYYFPNSFRGVDYQRRESSVSNTIKFSDDGTMAVDHGTSVMTASWPGGKKATTSGSYMNVWKRTGDTWKIIADMSQPAPPPPKS